MEGDGSMDEVKRTYRDVETDVKKTARGIDGTDPKDHVGNAGDEIGKDLGNLGDDIRKAGRDPAGPRGDPATSPERPM
jgi:hypothetical protein